MLRRKLPGALLLAGIASAVAHPALAQATVGADLSLFSGYVWRGISVTNRPVGQPNAYVTFPAGNTTVTVGGWANLDLGRYDDSDDFSQSGGASSFNLAEFDPWAEVTVPAGKALLTGGVVGYVFPNPPRPVGGRAAQRGHLLAHAGHSPPRQRRPEHQIHVTRRSERPEAVGWSDGQLVARARRAGIARMSRSTAVACLTAVLPLVHWLAGVGSLACHPPVIAPRRAP